LNARQEYEYLLALPEKDQASIIALASRFLYNVRRTFYDTHNLGGMGCLEVVIKLLKFLEESPEFLFSAESTEYA